MTSTLDASSVLVAIGRNPTSFPDAHTELHKAAVAIVTAQLKSKSLTVSVLSAVRSALGSSQFELILDHFPASVISSVVKRLDPHHPDKASFDVHRSRKHICELAAGNATPTQQPEKRRASKRPPKAKNKEENSGEGDFWPKSMTATGRRKNR